MERLWTRSFVQLSAAALFLFMSLYLLVPTLPLHIKQLGGSDAHVGLAGGVFTLAAVLCRPIVGGLLDRYGRWAFALGGIALFAFSMYAYVWIGVIAVLVAMRIIHGVGWAFATTAVGTAVTDIVPTARRGEGMGWYGLATTVAMAIGPSLGVWAMAQHASYGVFLFAASLAAVALLLALLTRMPFQPRAESRRLELYDRKLLPIMIGIVFVTVAYGAVVTFLPLFADSINVNAGTFFLVYAITLAAIRPLAGRLSDRYGETAVIVPGIAVTMLAVGLLSYAGGLGGVLVAAVLFGIGFGAAQPALQAAMLRLVSRDRLGLANASFFTAFDLGIGLGTIALGWVAQAAGYRALFAVGAGSVGVALVIFATVVRRLLQPRTVTR